MDSRPLFRKTFGLHFSAFTLFAVLAGCGPSFSRVSGTVTYKGQKLTMGTITFFSDDGKTKHPTSIGSNGYYEAIDPPLGKVRVSISVKPLPHIATVKGAKDAKEPKDAKDVPKASIGDATNAKIEPVIIPLKYADPGKSGLTTELRSGSNTYDVDLLEDTAPEKKGPEKKTSEKKPGR